MTNTYTDKAQTYAGMTNTCIGKAQTYASMTKTCIGKAQTYAGMIKNLYKCKLNIYKPRHPYRAASGKWGHCPRKAAVASVPTRHPVYKRAQQPEPLICKNYNFIL